jgi:hypothetical protein
MAKVFSKNSLLAVASQFQPSNTIKAIEPLGNGNVNQTFLVTTNSSDVANFVIQRLNIAVFSQPKLVV